MWRLREWVEKEHKRRLFAYSFALMDLKTRMYIAFGSSMKSEREAFDRTMTVLSSLDIEMSSVMLDRYYSSPSYVDRFGNARCTSYRRAASH